jgi:hypothetical protein
LYVFTQLLEIVEAEYGDDPEPEDLPRWKEIIDHANRLLGIEDEEEKGRDDGDTE